MHGPWERINIFSQFKRDARRRQGSTFRTRLNDQKCVAEPSNNSVAMQKLVGPWRCVGLVLRNGCTPRFENLLKQLLMSRWVTKAKAMGHHSNGAVSTCRNGATVCGRINAHSKPTDYNATCCGKLVCEPKTVFNTLLTGMTTANYANNGTAQQAWLAKQVNRP